MPQRIGPAGTVRVAVQSAVGAVHAVNVFWCQLSISGTVTQADLNAWTLAFGNAYVNNLKSQINSNATIQNVSSTLFIDGTPTNILQSEQPLGSAGTGGANNNFATAWIVSWITTAYWRGGKPRTYVPAGSATLVTGGAGAWQPSSITNFTTSTTNFMTAVNALTGGTSITGTALGFVSFMSALVDRVPPLFFPFTGFKIHPRIGEQKRRRGKWAV